MEIIREAPTYTSWKLPLCHPHGHCPVLPLLWESQHRFCSLRNFSFLLQISFKGLGDKLILHTCASGEMATVPGQGINTPFKVTLFILSFQQTNQIQHLAAACFTSPKALSDLEAVYTVCWNDPRHSVTIELYAVTPSSPPPPLHWVTSTGYREDSTSFHAGSNVLDNSGNTLLNISFIFTYNGHRFNQPANIFH